MTNTIFPMGFILLDFSKWPQLEKILFWFVAIFYIMIIFGNLTIIVLSCIDLRLSTPSYFFLSNLCSLELCFTTTMVCQMSNLWEPEKTITYTGYVIQLCAYLIHLACGDTSSNGWQLTISAILFTILPLGLILTPHGYIAQTVGKIMSEEGRQKAIATCSYHLLVVFMFYGTMAMVYTDPKNDFASKHGKFFTFFYTVVTPLLNPLIYTPRNKEIKEALLRLLIKGFSKQQYWLTGLSDQKET
nr:putative olfactory receptor 2W6 [Loxodonta africana]